MLVAFTTRSRHTLDSVPPRSCPRFAMAMSHIACPSHKHGRRACQQTHTHQLSCARVQQHLRLAH